MKDVIRVDVIGNIARVVEKPAVITTGTVGLAVEFTFDSDWEGLSKTVNFKACDANRSLFNIGTSTTVPWEVLQKPDTRLYISVTGKNDSGIPVINTIWASVGLIRYGASTDGEQGAEPTPPQMDQMRGAIAALQRDVEELKENQGHSNDICLMESSKSAMIRSINHRGYSTVAPENTLPAYKLSKSMGFNYAECDVSFTYDGVPVLLHDSTIDRTSNGSGSISAMTYAQASQYDYGIWKSENYAGTKLPTFEEFIALCKNIGLHPYIELKYGASQSGVQLVVDLVKKYGMTGNVTYISFDASALTYVKNYDNAARLGYVVSSVTNAVITTALGLKLATNDVFIDSEDFDDEAVALCMGGSLPLEVWTVNDESAIVRMNPYITGVTSDNLIAGKVLYDAYT